MMPMKSGALPDRRRDAVSTDGGSTYAMDDSELHRYAFWFRNHDVYRYAL